AQGLPSRLALELLALYLRYSPWERGRWRVLRAALPLARLLQHDKGVRTIMTRHGFRLHVELGDWLGRHVYVTGDYEPTTSRIVAALLQPGNIMVDVGANIGYFSLLASHAVGPCGKVFAFEPLPRTREQLARNLRINRAENVVVFEEAVCNQA